MPGNCYVQVLNTYVTRRLLLAVILGTLAICLIPVVAWWFASDAGPMDSVQSMFGVFLAFPAMLLGAHLKQQLATPEASLVPGYRRPHLIVGALTFLLPVIFAALVAPSANGSITGYASILLLVFLVFFKITADASRLGSLAMAALYLAALVPQLRIAVAQLLAGNLPGLAWCLLSAEAAFGVLLFGRLASLTEEDPSYGSVIPLNSWDMGAVEVRRRNRAQLQKSPRVSLSLLARQSRKLDQLTSAPATTFRQRVALQQMSGDWPVNRMAIGVMLILMEGIPLLLPLVSSITVSDFSSDIKFARALAWPLMLSLGIGWVLWLPQSQRWSRLGYESLRPSTRSGWVMENGMAIIRQTLAMQVVWGLVQVVLLFAFLPGFASSPVIANGLIFLTGAHVAVFGAGAWISSFGSTFWKMVGFMVIFGLGQPSWLLLSSYALRFNWQIPLFALTCAAVGIVLTGVAYRRWCRIDLM